MLTSILISTTCSIIVLFIAMGALLQAYDAKINAILATVSKLEDELDQLRAYYEEKEENYPEDQQKD